MLDGSQRAGTGAAVKSGDGDVIGVCLGDAGGDGANTDFCNQFDADIGLWIDVFQVMNQLRQVFDGINIMVWRR